jgi:hypothetical protein
MPKRLLPLLALAIVGPSAIASGASDYNRHFNASQIALAISQVPDSHSSWGRFELNPVLGRGAFGPRQLAIKAGVTTSLLVAQRHRVFKRHRRLFTVANFAVAGITLAVARRNYGLRF